MAIEANRRRRKPNAVSAAESEAFEVPPKPAGAEHRGTPVDAVLAQARTMIAANERLDMARLSAELGVDRTTLFRWVGNRDQLLVEVIWSVVEPLFKECVTAAEGDGAAYVARAIGRWVAAAHSSPELRAVVGRDPDRALRLLAGREGDLHRRLVAQIEKLLQQERAAGCLPHPVALGELAEFVARTANSYVWTDLVTGDEPDPVGAQVAVGLLLRATETES